MAEYKVIKSIATSWIKKGDTETNNFNKFIAYWIAFNCFYNNKSGLDSDRKSLEEISKDSMLNDSYKYLINDETTVKLTVLKNLCPIYNVGQPIKKSEISSIKNFKQVIMVLYQIRCNLFHGDKGEDIKRDRKVINAAIPVLEMIVKKMVKSHL